MVCLCIYTKPVRVCEHTRERYGRIEHVRSLPN